MKILVPISKVPDTTAKISFTDGGTQFDDSNVTYIMNPTDEWYALVRAIELKEQHGGSVSVINVGPAANDQIIRKALAIGADDAYRVDADPRDAFFIAKQIAEHAKDGGYDLILAGKETIDNNGFQVPGMIAELLDMPLVGLATQLDVADGVATIRREIEGGEETVEVGLPLVISAQKGMAEQRIPNMRGIMQARTKPLNTLEAVDAPDLIDVVRYKLPPEKGDVKLVSAENVDELVELLHKEAKAI